METKFENPDFTESSNDDDSSSAAPVTPYLLFYSDVLKELNSQKDAVDIAMEAKERWSKMTPRSLQRYIEMASPKSNGEPTEEPSKSENKNTEMGTDSTKNGKNPRKKARTSRNKPSRKRKVKRTESKSILRSSNSLAKRPINDWDKMINWVTSSRILRYKGKYAKAKSNPCRKKKSRKLKRKIKKKASKCKNCRCKEVKGHCPCHKKKKGKSSGLAENSTQVNELEEKKNEN